MVSVTQGLTHPGCRLRAKAPAGCSPGRSARCSTAGPTPKTILVLFPEWGEQADIALEIARGLGPPRPRRAEPAARCGPGRRRAPAGDRAAGRGLGDRSPDPSPAQRAGPPGLAGCGPSLHGRRGLGHQDVLGLPGPRAALALARSHHLQRERPDREGRACPAGAGPPGEALRAAGPARPSHGPSPSRSTRLVRIVEILHLGGSDASGLDQLRDALEDQAGVLDRLGRGEAPWSWSAFVREVESIVLDLKVPGPPPRPGSVRMATVGEAQGARAAFVILAGLSEGTFPAARRRRAVPVAPPGRGPRRGQPARLLPRDAPLLQGPRLGGVGRRVDLSDDRREGAGAPCGRGSSTS